jgi:holo-[acyl-carrier protein] synthase
MDAGLSIDAPSGPVVGVGIDLVDIDRIRDLLARRPRFAQQHFTAAERAWCDRRRDPAERYAARFAAKEATLKALGVGLGAARLVDLEVVTAATGAPGLVLHGSAAELAAERRVGGWHVSLSHSRTLATAVVVAVGRG